MTFVDKQGVLRWKDNGDEAALFGVNYCLPSASAYRMVKRVGASYEKTIDDDVAHFARMGLDGIRLSFWGDWECADENGNLIDNEHLRLLDYLIFKAKNNGIYMLLSPIILYDPRWPDDMNSPIGGFSKTYGKSFGTKIGTDPNGIKIQANYLSQIMRHVNRYTKIAYKDDPAIIGVELINEPYLPPKVTEYINTLAKAVRDTNCSKPIFFNVSQVENRGAVADIVNSTAEGVTFGWYPAELLAGRTLRGNFLTHVDNFPLMDNPLVATKAKAVYEFDTADVAGAYMYPAIARTFRGGGCQFAAMFTYDPLPIAAGNLEFQTHYLNLIYTPNKAVSFIIACRAFHDLPRLKSYGRYPLDCNFGNFRVSYEQNLSEMVSENKFLYSNDTSSNPPKPQNLEQIIGCGSSPIVNYEGTGSYFLDKIQAGLWRLEVYPDAIWVSDPYSKLYFGREVSRVLWHDWPMEINLPDLGQSFAFEAINKENNLHPVRPFLIDKNPADTNQSFSYEKFLQNSTESNGIHTKTANGSFTIHPGVYLLKRNDVNASILQVSDSFIAPPDKKLPMKVLYEPVPQISAGRDFVVKATVCNSQLPDSVTLYVWRLPHMVFAEYPMQRQKNYVFAAKIPAEKLKPGLIRYCITVQTGKNINTFPMNIQSRPGDWDFRTEKLWETLVVDADLPIVLYDASRDRDKLLFSQYWHGPHYTYDFVQGQAPGSLAFHFEVESLKNEPQDVSCRYILGPESDGRLEDMRHFDKLSLKVRAADKTTTNFGVTLLEKDGSAWCASVPITEQWNEISIPLSQFTITKAPMLPRGWSGHPYWLEIPANRGGQGDHLHIENIESIIFSIGARFLNNHTDSPQALELENVTLDKPR